MATLTAFGNLYELVQTLNETVTGLGAGISAANFVDGDLTLTLSDNTTLGPYHVQGGGISSISYDAPTLTVNYTDNSGGEHESDFTLPSPAYSVHFSVSASKADAIADAKLDYLGVLPALTSGNEDLDIDLLSPLDGRVLRFFNDTAAISDHVYNVKMNSGEVIAVIRGQEAYSLIYNTAASKWLIVPGIINVKAKPLGV